MKFAAFVFGSEKSASKTRALSALAILGVALASASPAAQASGRGGAPRTPVAPVVQIPTCIGSNGEVLSVDNDRVLSLKQTASVGKVYRALVQGVVTRNFGERCNSRGTCHEHFEIQLEGSRGVSGPLEVVYSEDFGEMKEPRIGAQVITCGDFINSNRPNGGYEASPSGAIIHWVHKSGCMDHENGFVHIDDDGLHGFGEDQGAHQCRPGVERRSE